MEYTLSLMCKDNSGKVAAASVGLYFPIEAVFSLHASVANSFTALIPLLLGEVAQKFIPEEEKGEENVQ
jgi:hypothetical protein